jgi:hypothetical protein
LAGVDVASNKGSRGVVSEIRRENILWIEKITDTVQRGAIIIGVTKIRGGDLRYNKESEVYTHRSTARPYRLVV